METKLNSFAISHKGLRRRLNEDSYLCKPDLKLFLVADGMGGAHCGDVASRLAVSYFESSITPYILDPDATAPIEHTHYKDHILNAMEYAALQTNLAVLSFSDEKPNCTGMGSTLTTGIIQNKHLYIMHVGDSRIYCYAKNLFQCTEDHTRVQQMVKRNMITSEEAKRHPQRHIITQCIGSKRKIKPQLLKLEIIPDAIYLICSDGLYDMVEDEVISEIISQHQDLKETGKQLIHQANQNGGKDNITAILFRQTPEI